MGAADKEATTAKIEIQNNLGRTKIELLKRWNMKEKLICYNTKTKKRKFLFTGITLFVKINSQDISIFHKRAGLLKIFSCDS